MTRHQNSLGPGHYDLIPSITPSGSYFVSKYQNSGCSIVGKAKRKSLADPSTTPGPGKCTFHFMQIKTIVNQESIKLGFISTQNSGQWNHLNSQDPIDLLWGTQSLCQVQVHSNNFLMQWWVIFIIRSFKQIMGSKFSLRKMNSNSPLMYRYWNLSLN